MLIGSDCLDFGKDPYSAAIQSTVVWRVCTVCINISITSIITSSFLREIYIFVFPCWLLRRFFAASASLLAFRLSLRDSLSPCPLRTHQQTSAARRNIRRTLLCYLRRSNMSSKAWTRLVRLRTSYVVIIHPNK